MENRRDEILELKPLLIITAIHQDTMNVMYVKAKFIFIFFEISC